MGHASRAYDRIESPQGTHELLWIDHSHRAYRVGSLRFASADPAREAEQLIARAMALHDQAERLMADAKALEATSREGILDTRDDVLTFLCEDDDAQREARARALIERVAPAD